MPTYAILGATGATGQSLLSHLLSPSSSSSSKTHIKAYVRSRSRLEKLSPALCTHENLQIFEGALSDIPLLANCIANTSAVFAVLGSNVSSPGVRIAQDSAQSVVAALCHLRARDPGVKLPRVLFLSSASLNPRIKKDMPRFASKILKVSLSHAYKDLRLAEDYLRLHTTWLNVVFIQPGGLTEDVAKGYRLSVDETHGFISYQDLAAGMVEVAERDGAGFDWMGVAVVPTGEGVKFPIAAPVNLARGLLAYVAPSVYWGFRRMGLVK